MKTLEEINLNDVKGAIKELNEAELLEEPIKFVGVKKEKIITTFLEAVENLDEDSQEQLPDHVVDMYNFIVSDEVVDPANIDAVNGPEDGILVSVQNFSLYGFLLWRGTQ